jgi:hypothetical protein
LVEVVLVRVVIKEVAKEVSIRDQLLADGALEEGGLAVVGTAHGIITREGEVHHLGRAVFVEPVSTAKLCHLPSHNSYFLGEGDQVLEAYPADILEFLVYAILCVGVQNDAVSEGLLANERGVSSVSIPGEGGLVGTALCHDNL